MGRKRTHQEAMAVDNKPNSPFMQMFERFKADLDKHYDRRERVIKASRDITAASKKMYASACPTMEIKLICRM